MAANAQGIRAGRAFIEIGGEDSKLVKVLRGAQTKIKGWGAKIRSLGGSLALGGGSLPGPIGGMLGMLASPAGLLGGLAMAAKAAMDMGGSLADMSQRTGASVEALSELGYAAEMSGVSTESLEGSLRFMQKNMVAAANGSKTQAEAFDDLGLSVADLSRLSPDKQFEAIADKISKIQNPAQRTAAAMAIFGKSGAQMLPMLADGAAGIEAMRERARELGLVMSREDAVAAEAFGDDVDTLWKQLKMVGVQIGVHVIGPLSRLMPKVQEVAKMVIDWVKENKTLILAIGGVATGLVALSVATWAIGLAFGGIATVIGIAASVLGFLLNPITLVIAGLGGLGAWFIYATEAGQDAAAWITDAWQNLSKDVSAAFGGIADAIAAGDIVAAWKVVTSLVNLEWQRVLNWLGGKWDDFTAFWNDGISGVALAFVNMGAKLRSVWADVVGWLRKKWLDWENSTFTESLANKIAPIVATIEGVKTEDVRKNLSKDFARKRATADADKAQIDAETVARQREIESERAGAEQAIGDNINARDAERQSRQDAAAAGVDAAKAEFRGALASARDKRKAAEEKKLEGGKKPGGPDVEGIDVKGKRSVSGTFSAFAVGRMGGSSAADRTAKNTELTWRSLARVEKLFAAARLKNQP